ncbi:HD domain-containing protein [Reichenbachiella agarivorans]|uniref:HD domain-containing protein n=1 Tax=Reichenbachiella agarivorans TaxID=2979464 RepID=A0ABY6CL75_9BACT|nr:HD domain-containing protein [Reichenbachiella agarivorans]UXP30835.1 HD domain-containing protein [Reichenbachiella agarivorans]
MANKSIPRIEGILLYYTKALGADYNAYRNHVYRVYHLTLLLHHDELNYPASETLAVAAAFHDLGIWTHNTLDYLEPSADLASEYLRENNSTELDEAVRSLIIMHHKLGIHKDNALAEAFRKADKMDLSFGFFNYKLPKSRYAHLKEEFPFLEFQKNIIRKVLRYALTHLNRPFPMLRR